MGIQITSSRTQNTTKQQLDMTLNLRYTVYLTLNLRYTVYPSIFKLSVVFRTSILSYYIYIYMLRVYYRYLEFRLEQYHFDIISIKLIEEFRYFLYQQFSKIKVESPLPVINGYSYEVIIPRSWGYVTSNWYYGP